MQDIKSLQVLYPRFIRILQISRTIVDVNINSVTKGNILNVSGTVTNLTICHSLCLDRSEPYSKKLSITD